MECLVRFKTSQVKPTSECVCVCLAFIALIISKQHSPRLTHQQAIMCTYTHTLTHTHAACMQTCAVTHTHPDCCCKSDTHESVDAQTNPGFWFWAPLTALLCFHWTFLGVRKKNGCDSFPRIYSRTPNTSQEVRECDETQLRFNIR